MPGADARPGAGEPIGGDGRFLPLDAVERIIAELRELATLAHPASPNWNPIRCYDHMIAHDDVVYVPYAFGYVNYAVAPDAPRLAFGDIPAGPPRGALLGGAGIGVSAFSQHREAAMDYALFLCSAGVPARRLCPLQAASRARSPPGRDAGRQRLTRDFFADTLATLQTLLSPADRIRASSASSAT